MSQRSNYVQNLSPHFSTSISQPELLQQFSVCSYSWPLTISFNKMKPSSSESQITLFQSLLRTPQSLPTSLRAKAKVFNNGLHHHTWLCHLLPVPFPPFSSNHSGLAAFQVCFLSPNFCTGCSLCLERSFPKYPSWLAPSLPLGFCLNVIISVRLFLITTL